MKTTKRIALLVLLLVYISMVAKATIFLISSIPTNNLTIEEKKVSKVMAVSILDKINITSSPYTVLVEEKKIETTQESLPKVNSSNKQYLSRSGLMDMNYQEEEQAITSINIPEETSPTATEPVVTTESVTDKDDTETNEVPLTEITTDNTSVDSTTQSNKIVDTAMQYLGYNYVSGGSSPSTGFDCSGFTKYVFGQCGYSLNRTASDQAQNGISVSKDQLQPGDLLLFGYFGSQSIGHTGIYIGNGQFIHSANSNRGVVIDTIESGYYCENYKGARRIQ